MSISPLQLSGLHILPLLKNKSEAIAIVSIHILGIQLDSITRGFCICIDHESLLLQMYSTLSKSTNAYDLSLTPLIDNSITLIRKRFNDHTSTIKLLLERLKRLSISIRQYSEQNLAIANELISTSSLFFELAEQKKKISNFEKDLNDKIQIIICLAEQKLTDEIIDKIEYKIEHKEDTYRSVDSSLKKRRENDYINSDLPIEKNIDLCSSSSSSSSSSSALSAIICNNIQNDVNNEDILLSSKRSRIDIDDSNFIIPVSKTMEKSINQDLISDSLVVNFTPESSTNISNSTTGSTNICIDDVDDENEIIIQNNKDSSNNNFDDDDDDNNKENYSCESQSTVKQCDDAKELLIYSNGSVSQSSSQENEIKEIYNKKLDIVLPNIEENSIF